MPQNKFSDTIMRACRERLGLEPDDISRDAVILRYTPRKAFAEKLEWEGIIGYSSVIVDWLQGAGYTVIEKP